MAHKFLITEGNVFVHDNSKYVLKGRGINTAEVENEKGNRVTLTRDQCPSLFQEILVG